MTSYSFHLTLRHSSDPVITREFDVPSSFTFKQLHYTIQYAMGWQCAHLHQFSFDVPRRSGEYEPQLVGLDIVPPDLLEDLGGFSATSGKNEDTTRLSDVFAPEGRLRTGVVRSDGRFLPLTYLYDFGDNWDHDLIFRGSKLSQATRPVFIAASGCGPVEDSGNLPGWESVKDAFRSSNPTEEQQERLSWAQDVSGLGDQFDPFADPDVAEMNNSGRWDRFLQGMEARENADDDYY